MHTHFDFFCLKDPHCHCMHESNIVVIISACSALAHALCLWEHTHRTHRHTQAYCAYITSACCTWAFFFSSTAGGRTPRCVPLFSGRIRGTFVCVCVCVCLCRIMSFPSFFTSAAVCAALAKMETGSQRRHFLLSCECSTQPARQQPNYGAELHPAMFLALAAAVLIVAILWPVYVKLKAKPTVQRAAEWQRGNRCRI